MAFDAWDKAGIAFVLCALASIVIFLVVAGVRKTRNKPIHQKPVSDERSSIVKHYDIIGRDVKRGL